MVKTLQLRQPMDQGSVLYDHIIAMGGSHNGKIWSFFFFDRYSAAYSHRDRLVDKKGCDTTREMTTAVSQGGP